MKIKRDMGVRRDVKVKKKERCESEDLKSLHTNLQYIKLCCRSYCHDINPFRPRNFQGKVEAAL